MKAQVPPGTSLSAPPTAVATPDNASIVSADDDNTLGNSTSTTDETVAASSSSVKSSSSKGKAKSSSESPTTDKKPEEPAHRSSTDNLTGKLNNLVTTDIQNIVEGRDFPLLSKRLVDVLFQFLTVYSCQCSANDWSWSMATVCHS